MDVLLAFDRLHYDQFEDSLSLAGMTREVVSLLSDLTHYALVSWKLHKSPVFSIELIIQKSQVDIFVEENNVAQGVHHGGKGNGFEDTSIFLAVTKLSDEVSIDNERRKEGMKHRDYLHSRIRRGEYARRGSL